MSDFEKALLSIRVDMFKIAQLERERNDLLNSPLSPAERDERDQDCKSDIERQQRRVMRTLGELVAFPPHHRRHDNLLKDFHGPAAFDKSVFVMTKFPDPAKTTGVDAELTAVIQAVRDAVEAAGYKARVASDNQYHSILWDNVELYLLGCKRGIAIVEDKYQPELNPNVAMEWGWMRGMGRNVLYLVEKTFTRMRADWSGLIDRKFDWAAPKPDIEAGVTEWLKNSV